MLKNLIKKNINIINKSFHWEKAIEISAKTLLESKTIEKSYVNKMISNVKEFGPYICLTSGFAMPHARPKDGVNKLGMALTLFKEDIEFPDNKNAKLFITLAVKDSDSHLEILKILLTLLEKDLEKILKCETIEEIDKIISDY